MKSLGSRLRYAREKKRWSQTYVCKKLGISNSALSGYERNYREPDANTLLTLADLYEVSVDFLLGRTGQTNIVFTEKERAFYDDMDKMSAKELKDKYNPLNVDGEEATEEEIEIARIAIRSFRMAREQKNSSQ